VSRPGGPATLRLVGGPRPLVDYGGMRILTDRMFDPPGETRTTSTGPISRAEHPPQTDVQARGDVESRI
jgi:hypothetical protein